MTRLDPSPQRLAPRVWMNESHSRESFSRHTGPRGREGESEYPSPPYRHSEVGHPLPSTRSPEPKASIPFRNPDLGLPSKRRNSEASIEPLPKYSQHSNFRQSPRSPSPYTPSSRTPSPALLKRAQSSSPALLTRAQSSSPAHGWGSSRSRSSSDRRWTRPAGSTASPSPSRSPSPPRGASRARRLASEDGRGLRGDGRKRSLRGDSRGLDSERLRENLVSIASAGSVERQRGSSPATRKCSPRGRDPSPPGWGYGAPGRSPPIEAAFDSTTSSRSRKTRESGSGADRILLPGSWSGSNRSLCSPALSRGPSPSRRGPSSRPSRPRSPETPPEAETRSGRSRRGPEAHSPSSQGRGRASSQSSAESEAFPDAERGTMGEYVVMADIPKTKPIYMREGPRQRGRSQSYGTGWEELRESARHSQTTDSQRKRSDSRERGRGRERGRERRERWDGERGRPSRTHSTAPRHMQRSNSPPGEEANPLNGHPKQPTEHIQTQVQVMSQVSRRTESLSSSFQTDHSGETLNEKPDLLNFKKGWMSMLDERREWRKHWFVLTDASLRYYRDLEAEETEDLDGEIDLKHCLEVSEFEVEKNYGFQIQTWEAVFTLSAMTSGIRRNWVEVLRKSAPPSTSPDITQLPDDSDKENSLSRSLPSRRHSSRRSHGEPGNAPSPRPRDHAEPANEKAPEGGGGGQRQRGRLEDRSRWFQSDASETDPAGSPWDAVVLKRGRPPALQPEEVIERKWAEFERREAEPLPLIGSLGDQSANEVLQREVASLRQQLACLQGGGGGGGRAEDGRHCGPDAPCGRSLEAMERAHNRALEELQEQHEREMRELERAKERLLREETQATAQVMEVLKKAHREELEQEVESVRRQAGAGTDTQALQQPETLALQGELDGLSERYSQKCLELNRAEQSGGEREREISRMEREMGQLRRENQKLQSRLTEEISSTGHSSNTGQGLGVSVSLGNHEPSSCELEMLLRVKENELQYLRREIGCLRDELHSLNKEKRSACERYKEVYVELGRMKSRSEREIEALKEHLKLAMAALQEGQQLENNLEH